MFFTLAVLPEEKCRKSKFSLKRRRAEIVCKKMRVKNSLPYFAVEAPLYKGKIPWDEIEEMFLPFYPSALLPLGAPLPEKSPLRAFESSCLAQLALFEGAVDFFKRRREKKESLLLFDEKGILAERAEKLVPVFQHIYVISENFNVYENVRQRLFEKFGVSIILAGKAGQDMFNADVIISKYARNIPAAFSGEVFCLESGKTLSALFHCSSLTDAPAYVKNSLPKGVSEISFAAALYEKCCLKELEEVKLIF